jgi:hypothetical protein
MFAVSMNALRYGPAAAFSLSGVAGSNDLP